MAAGRRTYNIAIKRKDEGRRTQGRRNKTDNKKKSARPHGRMIYELIACYPIPYGIGLSYNINQ
jgi:hypothetical protein